MCRRKDDARHQVPGTPLFGNARQRSYTLGDGINLMFSHVMSIPYKRQVSPTIFQLAAIHMTMTMTLLLKQSLQSLHIFWVCKKKPTLP